MQKIALGKSFRLFFGPSRYDLYSRRYGLFVLNTLIGPEQNNIVQGTKVEKIQFFYISVLKYSPWEELSSVFSPISIRPILKKIELFWPGRPEESPPGQFVRGPYLENPLSDFHQTFTSEFVRYKTKNMVLFSRDLYYLPPNFFFQPRARISGTRGSIFSKNAPMGSSAKNRVLLHPNCPRAK